MSSILRSLKLLKSRIISQNESEKKAVILNENEIKAKKQKINKLLSEKFQEVKKYQKVTKVEIGGIIIKISMHILDNCQFKINKEILISTDCEEPNFLDLPLSYLLIVLNIIRAFQSDSTEYNVDNPLEINLSVNDDIFQLQNLISSVFISEKIFDVIKLNKFTSCEYNDTKSVPTNTTVRQEANHGNRRGGRDPRYDNRGYYSDYSY